MINHMLSFLLQTDTEKISAVSIFFETMAYRLNEKTGYIDYDEVFHLVLLSHITYSHILTALWEV